MSNILRVSVKEYQQDIVDFTGYYIEYYCDMEISRMSCHQDGNNSRDVSEVDQWAGNISMT